MHMKCFRTGCHYMVFLIARGFLLLCVRVLLFVLGQALRWRRTAR